VTDLCGYNQSQPRRAEDVHATGDLLLSFRLGRVAGRGFLGIRILSALGRDDFDARLQFGGPGSQQSGVQGTSGLDEKGGQPFATCTIPASDAERLVEVSSIDRQFLLAVDGRTFLAKPLERSERTQPSATPLAIGVRGLAVAIRSLRVYRDVYYSNPIGPPNVYPKDRPTRLGANEYYVLGDNSPISEDSRIWSESAAIDAKWLLGKPLIAISSVCHSFAFPAIPSVPCSCGGPCYFQVPNLARIRYIR
jgi:signal peptidase I